jgi:DNA-binding protein HU-beta
LFFAVLLAFARQDGYSARGIPEAGADQQSHLRRKENSMANPLSKSKIIAHLADKVSTADKPVSKKQVASFFDELFKLAVKEAKSSGKFVIPGIGRAVKAHRKARMGRNPATGEAIKIKAKTVVRLRAAKAFKDAVLK